jgi:hypothetical protein
MMPWVTLAKYQIEQSAWAAVLVGIPVYFWRAKAVLISGIAMALYAPFIMWVYPNYWGKAGIPLSYASREWFYWAGGFIVAVLYFQFLSRNAGVGR